MESPTAVADHSAPVQSRTAAIPGTPNEPTMIRVIEVRRTLVDPMTAPPEELALLYSTLMRLPAFEGETHLAASFLNLTRAVQGPLAPFLAEAGPGSIDAVVVRDLLANPAMRPIVMARGAKATAENSETGTVLTRAGAWTRAIDSRGRTTAVAAEEPIAVSGFAINPREAGAVVILATGREALGLVACGEGGACSAAAAAALYAAAHPGAAPPEFIAQPRSDSRNLYADLRRRGFEVADAAAADVAALRRQAHAAVDFYLGGAAAAVAAGRIAAAVRGLPGAPPELLATLGPQSGILAATSAAITRRAPAAAPVAAWRDAESDARLRFLVGRLARSVLIAAANPATWIYDLNPLNDLYRVGALGIYLFALTEGRESVRLESFFERLATRHLKEARLGEVARLAAIASSRARAFMMIIEDKFGGKRARDVLDGLRTAVGSRARGAPGGSLALPGDSVQVDDPAAVSALLTKHELEVVKTEYDNRIAEWEAAAGNKCPHVRIVRRMRSAANVKDALTALHELEPYLRRGGGDQASAIAVARGGAGPELAARPGSDTPRRPGDAPRRPDDAPRRPGPAPATDWLMCRSCGFRALCPHVAERVALEARRASYDEVRTAVQKYAVRVGSQDTYTYYCRICSERLAEVIEEDRAAEELGQFGDLDAGLRTKIWVAALNAVRRVRFPTPTDERQFANTAARAIYPLLLRAEAAVAKNGRRRRAPRAGADEDDLDPRTQLYIIIFVYAYILDLIRTSHELGRSELSIGLEGVKPGAKASAYADAMFRIITEDHRVIVAQIEDITADFLKARFTEAYRLVRGDATIVVRTVTPEEELAVQTTTVDPVYQYAGVVARVAGALPIAAPADPAAARREFETIVGQGLDAIIRTARASAQVPALAPLFLRRSGVEVPPDGDLNFLMKDPRVNLYANLYEPATADRDALAAFQNAELPGDNHGNRGIRFWIGAAERTKAKPKAAVNPADPNPSALAERGAFFEAYRLFAQYTKSIFSREAYDAYLAELAEYRRHEEKLRGERALAAIKPYYDFEFSPRQQYSRVAVPITALYDEQGRRHDWRRKVAYLYRDGAALVEIKGGVAGVKAAREEGTLTPAMTLVDLKCGDCGVLASAVADLDTVSAEKSMRAVSEIDSFFVFYEARCPVEGLHEWAGQACARCGLSAQDLKEAMGGSALKNVAARAYYDKYSARFADERRAAAAAAATATAATATSAATRSDAAIAADLLAEKRAAEWRPDYTVVVTAAELAGVTPATIEAIGNCEGREYADIVEGRRIPDLPAVVSDPRIYTADAEVRLFLADYNTLRGAARVTTAAAAATAAAVAAAETLAAAEVPLHEYGLISRVLPDISESYYAVYAAIRRSRPPADAYTFSIQSLCRMAIAATHITSAAAPWAARLGATFAKKELATILRSQKLFSKPGTFNWSIFEAEEDLPEQAGDVGEDIVIAESEEAPEDPFSGENMDYDTSEANPNNEPD